MILLLIHPLMAAQGTMELAIDSTKLATSYLRCEPALTLSGKSRCSAIASRPPIPDPSESFSLVLLKIHSLMVIFIVGGTVEYFPEIGRLHLLLVDVLA